MDPVIVVGSGLAAIGAIRALLERGIRPIVLDIGDRLPPPADDLKRRLARTPPDAWAEDAVRELTGNRTASGLGIPKKLAIGSDYFYADENVISPAREGASEGVPPYSTAAGGFSVGWGGTFLPPRAEDLDTWPISADELHSHMRGLLRDLPASEPTDSLTRFFPSLVENGPGATRLSSGQAKLVDTLEVAASRARLDRCGAGQARLLTNVLPDDLGGCRYCGRCMAGCVYGSIYSAEDELDRLTRLRAIDYRSGIEVVSVKESRDAVTIDAREIATGCRRAVTGSRVLVAAGATASTRIMLRSDERLEGRARLRRIGGFVMPMVSVRSHVDDWPFVNTQSTAFLDFVDERVSPRWIHAQISLPNELALSRIGIREDRHGRSKRPLRDAIANHSVVVLVNLHSDHGGEYHIQWDRRNGHETWTTVQHYSDQAMRANTRAARSLQRILSRVGVLPLPFLRQDSMSTLGFGTHTGGSFPMVAAESPDLGESDALGRPSGWRRTHLVDSSAFPSLPGTTVGLLAMANAHRIASQLPISE